MKVVPELLLIENPISGVRRPGGLVVSERLIWSNLPLAVRVSMILVKIGSHCRILTKSQITALDSGLRGIFLINQCLSNPLNVGLNFASYACIRAVDGQIQCSQTTAILQNLGSQRKKHPSTRHLASR